MSSTVTRTQVAEYVASQLVEDRTEVIKEAAAWLISTNRIRQMEYFVSDVTKSLLGKGYLYAKVTSAYSLDESSKNRIKVYLEDLGAKRLEIKYELDPDLIGGIKIETPTDILDASIRMKLDRLVEGLQ